MAEEKTSVTRLTSKDLDQAADALSEAFEDYPVMRFVIGQAGEAYASRLFRLMRFFVLARLLYDDLVLGVRTSEGTLAAVANIVRPGQKVAPPELANEREVLWRALGADARARYEHYGVVSAKHVVEAPHYHLAMIGVRRAHTGRGLARRLLDVLHEESQKDPNSCGVTLNTEDPSNVPLYEHVGYRIIGRETVSDVFTTWSFFRPDEKDGR